MLDKRYFEIANNIFTNPGKTLDWSIVTKNAVASNTFRGFHRINKEKPGASRIFQDYFLNNSKKIIEDIKSIKTENDLDTLSEKITSTIREKLDGIVKAEQIKSYNKVRKPIDLYIEHLVAACNSFDKNDRIKMAELYFLPLDSQIFESNEIFTERNLRENSLSKKSTYGDVRTKEQYNSLQKIAKERAIRVSAEINCNFRRIYFDLIWGNRASRGGLNIFDSNPK